MRSKTYLIVALVCFTLALLVGLAGVRLHADQPPIAYTVVTTPTPGVSGQPVYLWCSLSTDIPIEDTYELWFYVAGPAEERSPQPAHPGWFGPVSLAGTYFGLGAPPVWLYRVWTPNLTYYGTFTVYAQVWDKRPTGYVAVTAPSPVHHFTVTQ